MKLKRNLKNDVFAVSVVIGVVLMVSVSVTMAATILTFAQSKADAKNPVTDGLAKTYTGVASDDTLQLLANDPGNSDVEDDNNFDFIITDSNGETITVPPEIIGMTSAGIADGDEINIKSLVEEAFGDQVKSDGYTITVRNDNPIFKKEIVFNNKFDLTFESNNPTDAPIDPIPADLATDISLNPELSTLVSDPDSDPMDVTFYDASDDSLIGTDVAVASGTRASYIWSDLEYDTTYTWYTIADDGEYTTQSATWQFTTTDEPNNPPYAPSDPSPTDGATDVSITASLSWTGGDPDGDPVTYDVYFGTNVNPSFGDLVSKRQTETSYDPGTLSKGETYYWKIVAYDIHDAYTVGDVWIFETIPDLMTKL